MRNFKKYSSNLCYQNALFQALPYPGYPSDRIEFGPSLTERKLGFLNLLETDKFSVWNYVKSNVSM